VHSINKAAVVKMAHWEIGNQLAGNEAGSCWINLPYFSLLPKQLLIYRLLNLSWSLS